jgi:D-serine deaminase-like pyridoxal phosphate-dependent protein
MAFCVDDLPTPALLLHEPTLETNIRTVQAKADQLGWRLRPHIKTHKMPALAQRQSEAGATGIAVATLHEATKMVEAGFTNPRYAWA